MLLRVENVSKQYRIYDRPSNRLKEALWRGRRKYHREFWALKDVSFDVAAGETVGVIGVNGSGKSTLLQIITGTLAPTHGSVTRNGRVSALLELGAGFNPEFTGVENVFMNAALLGLSRSETEELLPEIARFAEIGDFLYQPVKTYSSGMYVRLAFSVAVSVEPQILIVDEALAVGDAVFQHRCLRRIKQMQERGATILFVSHDAGAVRALCSRAILLNAGRVVADGKPMNVFNRYQQIVMTREEAYSALSPEEGHDPAGLDAPSYADDPTGEVAAEIPHVESAYRHGDGSVRVLSVELLDSSRRRTEIVESGEAITARLRMRFDRDTESPVCGILIRDRHGIHVYGTNTALLGIDLGAAREGTTMEVSFAFRCGLAPGVFSLTVAAHSPDGISYDWMDTVLFFRVVSAEAMDGIANLGATATARVLRGDAAPAESIAR